MKYNILNQAIPQNSRRELNDKILYLIDNDLAESSGITKEDIYNAYTGDGGLHGLKYSDFDSYYEYSNAKKEIENGQFFTPPMLWTSLCYGESDEGLGENQARRLCNYHLKYAV